MAILLAGEGSSVLGNEIAQRLKIPVGSVEFKTFPDGEEYARLLPEVKGEDVIVVQTTFPPARLWRLLLTLSAAKEAGAARIRAVVPYLAYARQDRLFKPGEALSARLVADCLGLYAAQVVTVDAHKDEVRRFFKVPIANVSSEVPMADELKRLGIQVVLAPDAGAMPRAQAVAKRVGAEFDFLEKKRISSDVVEITPKSLDVKGKSVAILDDIISTGGTMAKALEQLRKNGAREVVAACVHGLFMGDAVDKLKRAGAREILATNTIEGPYSRVSVAEAVTKALATNTPLASARRPS